MPTEDVEMLAFRVFFDYGARPQSEAGADLHVLKLVLARGQCFVEHVGLAVRCAVIQPHSRFDEAGGLFCGDGFTRHWKPCRGGYSLWHKTITKWRGWIALPDAFDGVVYGRGKMLPPCPRSLLDGGKLFLLTRLKAECSHIASVVLSVAKK